MKYLFPAGAALGSEQQITVGGNLGTRPVDAWCSNLKVAIKVADKGNKLTIAVAKDAQPGVCFVRLFNAEGASSLRPVLIGKLPDVVEREPNDSLSQATQLKESRAVVHGVLAKSGDSDAFAVALKTGQTLVAAVDAHERLGSPMDAVVQILTPRGFVAVQNDDDRGFDPLAVYTAREDGTHYVRIFAFPAAPNSTIRLAGGSDYVYRMTITTGPFANHPFPLAVTQGKSQQVRFNGWNIPNGLAASIKPDAAAASALVTTPELANEFPIPVVPHPALVEAEANANSSPQNVTPPVTVTGVIQTAGDVDEFSFNAKKKQQLDVRVESRSLGYPLDAVLEVLDTSGKVLKRVDDAKRGEFDSSVRFIAPADGHYTVRVSDLYLHGGPRYAYRLTIEKPQSEFAVSVTRDAYVLKVGKPLKIPVSVARRNGFAEEITVTAVGLPQGVKCVAVKSSPKGKTAKSIELVLEAAAAVKTLGPFRIEARAKARTSAATTAVAGTRQTADSMWLTVVK